MPLRERLTQILRPRDYIRQSDATSLLLGAEIEQCLSSFERTESETRERVIKAAIKEAEEDRRRPPVIPEIFKGPVKMESIHGRNYTVGRLGNRYFWKTGDNVPHVVGKEAVPGNIVDEIQNITLPYAAYVQSRGNKT